MSVKDALTKYSSGEPQRSNWDKIGNAMIKPLEIAYGRKVRITKIEGKELKFSQEKPQHFAVRVFAGIGAVLLLPATLIGAAHKYHFSTHKDYLAAEKEALRQEAGFEKTSAEEPSKPAKEVLAQFLEGDALNLELLSTASFEEFRDLKRALSSLAKQEIQQGDSDKFRNMHEHVRQRYYEKFAINHMLDNLKTKQSIPVLNLKLTEVAPKNASAVLEDMEQAFKNELNPSHVTWVHGTQSPTLVAMAKGDQTLKTSDDLQKENELAFTGENAKGLTVSKQKISGASLDEASSAILYAKGGVGFHDQVAIACTREPEAVMKGFYTEKFDEWLAQDVMRFTWDSYNKYCDYEVNLYNLMRHMKILSALEPDLFKQLLLPKIEKLVEKLDSIIFFKPDGETNWLDFKNEEVAEKRRLREYENKRVMVLDKMLKPLLQLDGKLPSYTDEELQLIQQYHPVVFGSTNMKLIENEQDALAIDQKVAMKVRAMVDEYTHKGKLKLGTDLPFVFVPQDCVEQTYKYLSERNINVQVCNIESLHLASNIQKFKQKKAQRKVYKLTPSILKKAA